MEKLVKGKLIYETAITHSELCKAICRYRGVTINGDILFESDFDRNTGTVTCKLYEEAKSNETTT